MIFRKTIVGFVCAMLGLALSAQAAIYYVAPSASGAADGSDWANAYGVAQLQAALNACSSPGDEIRLRYGVYSNSAELTAVSRPGLTIRGGYQGSGEDVASDPTVLTRALMVTNRILYGQSSTLTFERLSITNGMTVMPTNDSFGAGLYLSNCVTLVTNCLFEANRLPIPYRNPATTRAHKGGGICAIAGVLTVVSSRFRDNSPNYVYAFNNTGSQFGNGVYAQSASVTLSDTIFEYQATGARDGIYGGGLYLYGGSATVTRCAFNTNTIYNGWTGNGAALYAENVRPLAISNCTFRGNTMTGPSMSYGQGGALYIASCYPFLVSNCVFESQAVRSVGGVSRGSTLWLAGAGLSGTIADCSIAESGNLIGVTYSVLEKVYLDISSTNRVNIRNVTIQGGPSGGGIYKMGTGVLTITNCLVALTGGAGLESAGGTTLVSQCTFADNYGWGISNSTAPVVVSDSILWGNRAGGVKSTNVAATYTSLQEPLAGAGNLVTNPLFAVGYYLSVNGLPAQIVDSPCLDLGSRTAAAAGMDSRTTRTDGTGDAGQVDLGYHPAMGFTGSFSDLNLYVNVVTGSDANDGWTAGTPLKTITAALGKTIDGSTIYVATGRYVKASGEVFPLTSRTPNLRIVGANRDTTLLDATFTNRIFTADGRGRVWFEGLTFTNGNDAVGAGLYLPICWTVVTNCAFVANRPIGSGLGIYVQGGTLDLLDSVVKNNGNPTAGIGRYGGGLYASQAALVLRQVTFDSNFLKAGDNTMYGGAMAIFGGRATFTDCTFNTNFLYNGYYLLGGAVYASGVSPLTFSNCVFRGNYLNSTYYYGRGGALYIAACPTLTVANCSFSGSGVTCGSAGLSEGNDIYLTGASGGTISDCSIVATASAAVNEGFYIETPSPNTLAIRNLSMRGGGGVAIRKRGTSTLSMTNLLVSFYGSHGLQAEAGTVSVAHASFGDNVGWGLMNGAATLTVSDSIAWGNGAGGMSPGAGAVSYSCSQEILPGTANMAANPAWIAGYYLSVAGLPVQTVDSPCRDAGSKPAAAAGLDSLTTRTDGGVDEGTVDLGYHYGAGSSMVLSNLMLYVNVVTGNDAFDGWTAGSPLKTITAALAKAVDGTAVYVATGRYYRASGEVFPLTSQAPNLSLKGENRDTTILDATLTNRVFSAEGRGKIWLEGLTFVNGSVTSAPAAGGGIYLPSCVTVITNCTVVSNRITTADIYGGGIYVLGGSLTLADSRVQANGNGVVAGSGGRYGGGLFANGAALQLRNSLFAYNTLAVNAPASGAGLYLSGGSALIDGCTFNTNYTSGGHQHAGAALYATGVSPLTLTNSMFRGNYLYSSHYFAKGAALYVSGGSLKVASCVFTGNTATVVTFSSLYADGLEGPLIWAGGLSGSIAGCDIWGQTYSVLISGSVTSSVATNGLLFVDVPLTNSFSIANTFLRGGGGIAIRKRGVGLLAMTNSLVHSFTNHGVLVDAGSVVLANSTFANNGGWGVSNALGAVTGKNSIAWGNAKGGFTNAVLTFTCSQEAQAGTGNKNQDPLFAGAAANDFRLVRTSPCVNAGSNESWMAVALDLAGNPRIIGKITDMGAFENTTPPVNGTVIMVR